MIPSMIMVITAFGAGLLAKNKKELALLLGLLLVGYTAGYFA